MVRDGEWTEERVRELERGSLNHNHIDLCFDPRLQMAVSLSFPYLRVKVQDPYDHYHSVRFDQQITYWEISRKTMYIDRDNERGISFSSITYHFYVTD